jgi:hypothetical protein
LVHVWEIFEMLIRSSYIRRATLGILSAFTLVISMAPAASAQEALVTGLKQRYRLSEINMQGVVAEPGTVLTVEADGINAEPYPTMITFENPVVDGQIKQRSKFLGLVKSNNMQILQPGQKVYITKINADSQNNGDALKVTILTTDAVLATFTNGTYGGTYQVAKRYSTTLDFKEPKGALEQMSVDDASKLIEAVLSFNPADQVRGRAVGVVTRSCEPHCAVSATTGQVVGAPVMSPSDQQQSNQQNDQQNAPQSGQQGPPPTVSLGQTPDQVTGILGQPQQIINLGAKQIYKYPDMKVIFMNGKVSDVQ